MSDYTALTNFSPNTSERRENPNLTIPEAAMDLAVSETRLRKTLAEGTFPTEFEFRQTRTGVRKTAMLPPATIERLRQHYRALEQTGMPATTVPASAWLYPPADNSSDEETESEYQTSRRIRESAEEAAYLAQKMKEKNLHLEEALSAVDSLPPAQSLPASAAAGSGSSPGVPLAQFNTLQQEHHALRADLTRMSQYLADCDHLLEEMIKTIVTLEAKMQSLERNRPPARSSALSGALRSVSEGFQNAFTKRQTAAARPAPKSSEVYYANVLSRS